MQLQELPKHEQLNTLLEQAEKWMKQYEEMESFRSLGGTFRALEEAKEKIDNIRLGKDTEQRLHEESKEKYESGNPSEEENSQYELDPE